LQEHVGVAEHEETLEAWQQQVQGLEAVQREWDANERLLAYRLLRDSSSRVWQAACAALGRRAGWDGQAREELVTLLASPSWEIRLRGVRALHMVAPGDSPEELKRFLEERLEEAVESGDVVLLDAVVRGLIVFHGKTSLLQDPRELVRAAAVVYLEGQEESLLEEAARDPSVRVRVALASTLAEWESIPLSTTRILLVDSEPMVRSTLAEALNPQDPDAFPFLEALRQDPEPLVREAVLANADSLRTLPAVPWAQSPPARMAELAQALDANPEQPLEVLREVLDMQDTAGLAELAEVVRDPDLADLCRALSVLTSLSHLLPAHARMCMLEALGHLPAWSPLVEVRQLRALLIAWVRAVEVESVEDLLTWEPSEEEIPEGPATEVLRRLAGISAKLGNQACCTDLAEAEAELGELRFGVERDLPEPERAISCLVIQVWIDALQQGIDGWMRGAES
jgi:HEAT repeat protein